MHASCCGQRSGRTPSSAPGRLKAILALVDEHLVQTIEYGPYGENPSASGSVAYSPAVDPFMFQGGYNAPGGDSGYGDVPNGFYHFGERFYDPTIGRWAQPDPAAGGDEYQFANDDPINEGDPSGMRAQGYEEPDSCIWLAQHNTRYLQTGARAATWWAVFHRCRDELSDSYKAELDGTSSSQIEAWEKHAVEMERGDLTGVEYDG